jgi:hypothetical protein
MIRISDLHVVSSQLNYLLGTYFVVVEDASSFFLLLNFNKLLSQPAACSSSLM